MTTIKSIVVLACLVFLCSGLELCRHGKPVGFNALLCRALGDRDFDRAEFMRMTWLEWLNKIEYAEPDIAKARIKKLETFVIPVGNDGGLEIIKVSIH